MTKIVRRQCLVTKFYLPTLSSAYYNAIVKTFIGSKKLNSPTWYFSPIHQNRKICSEKRKTTGMISYVKILRNKILLGLDRGFNCGIMSSEIWIALGE